MSPALPGYAELHCISNFTFLRGASHPEELISRAHQLGYRALAITDECSVAGVVRAHVRAKQRNEEALQRGEPRIQFIVGSEVRLEDGAKVVLLAADRGGYGNLCHLITLGRRRKEKGSYSLDWSDLDSGLPGCLALHLPGPGNALAEARALAERFAGRAWIAAELLCGPNDRAHMAALRQLGDAAGLPLVAAGDVHMHVRSRRPLQDTLIAIRLGKPVQACGHALHANAERHLRLRMRLGQLYPPVLLAETLRIAGRCRFSLDELRYEYPEELVPDGETPATHLRRLTEAGARKRFPGGVTPDIAALLERELTLIAELHYEPFFLTVHDIVQYARREGILCQGRGSAANSAVCYVLEITEVNPLKQQLLFERFISRERNEPPDIDVDFEHQRREEVIQYIYGKYGRERAAIAATVISYRPKSALRDVGKALGLDQQQVERIAKSIAWWDDRRQLAGRIAEAGFDPAGPLIARLIALSDALLGFPRHLSQHVGGFVISRGPLAQLVPVENAAMPDRSVIQWDKDDLDALGLLKVDVLALGMLSAIRRALAMINQLRSTQPPVTMDSLLQDDDPAVYEMIQRADTVGVFQIESRAQMSMLPRLKPETFYDLVIEIAIVRPGPIQGDMVHPYLRRKSGKEAVTYPNDAIRKVLQRTLGVPIFQEQVMHLAVVAAGFTPGEADQLRRAMAAWRRKGGLEPFQEKLIKGMRERGIPDEFAERIYRQILGFGEYGFPESHSVSFALLAYVSAWIKRYEPAAFLAALLNSQPMGFYAPAQLLQDARRHGVEVRPADVLCSQWASTLEPEQLLPVENRHERPEPGRSRNQHGRERSQHGHECPQHGHERSQHGHECPQHGHECPQHGRDLPQPAVRLGLSLVKGLAEGAARRIVAARVHPAPASVAELAHRAALNRSDLQCLAAAGALRSISGHRRLAYWDAAGVETGRHMLRDAPVIESMPDLAAPSEGEDIVADYASLGLTLGRHPLALLRRQLAQMRFSTADDLLRVSSGRRVRAAGLVTGRQRPDTASGVVFVTLEDETGYVNVIVWRDLTERQRRELLGSRLLGVQGVLERQGKVMHLVAERLEDHSRLLGCLTARSRDFH
ncbi:MAG: error-prone DNA polymerase [Betaproteobacteria bacterium]|nr:error-prone DNA polymerase [Betaproteobacteria bacterium]